jgi:3-isopropylmalate dehydrogenase
VKARIALLPGDGIGPEVTSAAALALTAAARRFGHTFELRSYPIGGAAIRETGHPLPQATLAACLQADAVLLGAVGDPAFDREEPDRRPEAALLALRRELGVYANLRPARVYPGLETAGPLQPAVVAGVDLLIVRELTGGLYYGTPRGIAADGSEAHNTLRYTRGEIERVAARAFELARARRRRLTSVDKANVLETSRLWRAVVTEMGAAHPDVALEHMYVDNCAMQLVRAPSRFDVIVTENMFGDILSDEAGAVVGSLGLLPSASIGRGPGLFEPVHGSAPDLSGQDAANPIGAIASAAMLLRDGLTLEEEAQALEAAIADTLATGARTADLVGGPERPGAPQRGGAQGSVLSCSQMASAITDRVNRFPAVSSISAL